MRGGGAGLSSGPPGPCPPPRSRLIDDLPVAVLGHVRIETVTISVTGFLEFEQIAAVVELVAPPARGVEYIVARTNRLQTKQTHKHSLDSCTMVGNSRSWRYQNNGIKHIIICVSLRTQSCSDEMRTTYIIIGRYFYRVGYVIVVRKLRSNYLALT